MNRALLARQVLLARGRAGGLVGALERVGGLQAQYAPSMYIGLWSRIEGFQRSDLDRALVRRTVVQGTLMRATIHLVSARDYWPFAVAIRERRRQWSLRTNAAKLTGEDMAAAARRLREAITGKQLRRGETEALLGKPRARDVGMWLDLVRVPPSGTWERRRADLYAAAEDWVGHEGEVTTADATAHLVRSYLRGFGPASRKDIASYTGLMATDLAPVLEHMTLRSFRSDSDEELLDLPRAPLPDGDTPAPVRFLPTWDATLLVHARRTGILPEQYRPIVFSTKTPHSFPTFLVDGAVAGTWKYQHGRVQLEPFARLDKATRRELDDEAERLAGLHA